MANEIKIQNADISRISELDQNNIGFGKIFTDHMFVSDWDGASWTDHRIEPFGKMSLSPATSAIHYGQAIFEGMKAFSTTDGIKLFRPTANLTRLNISAERMVMPAFPMDLFMKALKLLVSIDKEWVPSASGSALYIRPYMFATDDFIGVRPSVKYRMCIFCCPVGPYYSNPLKVKVEDFYSRAAPGGTGFTKCAGNYGASMLPTKLAQDQGYDQVLWTDPVEHKYVEETGTTNVFAVIGDEIITPALDHNLLAGITRDSVIKAFQHFGIGVTERKLSIDELKQAHDDGLLQEMFITGTAATLINLKGFGYMNKYYDVMENGDTSKSQMVKEFLDNLRYGKISDPFGWMESIDSPVAENA